MSDYRRDYSANTWFFTVVTHERRPILTSPEARQALRTAIGECRTRFPFDIDAWVLLPDHLHAVWTLPECDRNYSRRWSVIKRRFTQQTGTKSPHGDSRDPAFARPFWQPRFWAHRLSHDRDYEHHVNYVHINPLKHGFVERVRDWPWSSFHRLVHDGVYEVDWGRAIEVPEDVGRE